MMIPVLAKEGSTGEAAAEGDSGRRPIGFWDLGVPTIVDDGGRVQAGPFFFFFFFFLGNAVFFSPSERRNEEAGCRLVQCVGPLGPVQAVLPTAR